MDDLRQARLAWMVKRARLVEQLDCARKHADAVFSRRKRHRLVSGRVQLRAANRVERLSQELKTFDARMAMFLSQDEGSSDG